MEKTDFGGQLVEPISYPAAKSRYSSRGLSASLSPTPKIGFLILPRCSTRGCKSQGDECLLLHFVGLGATGGWAGAGGALNGEHGAVRGNASQTGHHIEHGTHVGWFFLHPDDFAGRDVTVEFYLHFGFGEGIELVEV